MKKKRRTKRATYWGMAASTTSWDWGMAASTTSWDWGFKPVPNKGGNTNNHEIQESMFQREIREMNDK